MEESLQNYGILGAALMALWRALAIIDRFAVVKMEQKNGVSRELACIKAVEKLATTVDTYVKEDRYAHNQINADLAILKDRSKRGNG